ncbi:MAG: SIMPL domain-containing protein [Myxococcota bacterium]
MTAVLLLLVLLLAHPALADDAAVIRVTGEATVSVAPDEGRIDLGVMTEDANAERAARLNATKLEAVLGALRKGFGTSAKIKTLSYSLTPKYRYPSGGGQRELDGYTATNVVRVTTGKLDDVGRIVDAATSAGANSVRQLQFRLRDEEPTRAAALREATLRARSKAEAIAQALDLKIEKVISVDEGGVSLVPVEPRMKMMGARAGGAPTPVEPGSIDVRASLTLSVEAGP